MKEKKGSVRKFVFETEIIITYLYNYNYILLYLELNKTQERQIYYTSLRNIQRNAIRF